MSKLRVISDVHGCIDNRVRFEELPSYIELCQSLGSDDYSVQLGDLGFDYTPLNKLDHNQHVVCLGNHESYDTAFNYPHMLGDYGMVGLGPFNFFFVRGGFSLDVKYRLRHEEITGVKSWWSEEELNLEQGLRCLDLYQSFMPDVVLSHECPATISSFIGNQEILEAFGYHRSMVTRTQDLMEQMLEIHRPKLWVFGHYHKNWSLKYKGTQFMCLAERHYVDFDENWNMIGRT